MARLVSLCIASTVSVAGCQSESRRAADLQRDAAAQPQQEFIAQLRTLCGKAYQGRLVEDSTGSPDFAGKAFIMHVRLCESDRILVPFHVGEDRSRTWIFTPTEGRILLKHDHRHKDGSEDEITMYGGWTQAAGTPERQEFYADAHTSSLIPAASTNVWTVELVPGDRFIYSLRREGTSRRFRVEFDLTEPVPAPPPPWGWE